jgi:hypothetical protein
MMSTNADELNTPSLIISSAAGYMAVLVTEVLGLSGGCEQITAGARPSPW